jgi:LmbE family N-acetylglucosaminyl deacetylase
MMTMTTASDAPLPRIMAIFAHPDDPEFFCGGTIARWCAESHTVTYVIATSGDKGTAQTDITPAQLVAQREDEQRSAARVLGVSDVLFLRFHDGELFPDLTLRRAVTRVIRHRQPEIVVTCDPTVVWFGERAVNHADHRAIGQATLDAVYPTARDHLNFPQLAQDEGLPPHKVKQVWLCPTQSGTHKVDVTSYLDQKIAALCEHKSQIADMDAMETRQRSFRDPEAPAAHTRYVESFRIITFDR